MTVLANDFKAQWEELREDVLAAVDRVGRSGWLVLGDEVRAFETALAQWWGLPHAVGVASGLDAIEIGLRCAGIGEGDRVLTTPLTAFATTLAVLRAGAEPVWVDVDATGALDLDLADQAMVDDEGIRAVVPVHLFGHPMDPQRLTELAQRHGVTVLEDCAQSAGATRAGRPTGAAGGLAATSLYPTKNLGALGDGGVLLCASEEHAVRARTLRDYGQDRRYHHAELGLNSRLDELHAAMLRSAMLPRLDRWLARRAEVADHYARELTGMGLEPVRPTGGSSANHLFPVLVADGPDPEALAGELRELGVVVGRHYPFLCPDQPAAQGRGRTVGELANARRFADRELSLPLHPQLSDADVDTVVRACRQVAG
ncbi:DegT/DnrJ/EryC1/StrS aminotransferase family protein [Conexibacter sp. SYSU D00693]|uniref:DegT/DnrJ/EryC1/StrS family aminotransferase n=1 Tax=Conexibacter sp. SYSU D00693 TaxID=2812560 RepID=UPI00196B5509|nr:DegT/DnrJ/EryC1/StrS family aminotransferase [Conexibacter sp. SYSU D00693]